MTQASVCVKSMEEAVGRVIEGASGVTKKETLQTLCLDVIKGNNLTQCYLEATGGCAPQSAESPTSTMAAWERVMQDLYQMCDGDCGNFDEALSQLEKCKSHVANLPDDLDAACSAYREFRTCLHSSDVPLTCPMFGALMDVLYPQHIFGLYEEQCNITGTEDTGPGTTAPAVPAV
nr:hypothetical protein BaRGS_032036 [Batillaria attramentaria]